MKIILYVAGHNRNMKHKRIFELEKIKTLAKSNWIPKAIQFEFLSLSLSYWRPTQITVIIERIEKEEEKDSHSELTFAVPFSLFIYLFICWHCFVLRCARWMLLFVSVCHYQSLLSVRRFQLGDKANII